MWKGCTVVLMNIFPVLLYKCTYIVVKYIHTLINGNPQGAMLAIQNKVLGQLAPQIYNLIKYIFQTIPLL
jgi:hypothetical protein